MKKFRHLLVTMTLTMFSISQSLAQRETFLVNDTTENGSVKFRKYNTSLHKHPVTSEIALLKSTLGISANDELVLVSATMDEVGFTHNFYQQYYKGIKVEHASYATHSRNGNIERLMGGLPK